MGKTIGILSLKGGVGKTSTVVALGGAFAKLGKKVLLIDGNLSAPNLGIHLNLINPKHTLQEVLKDKKHAKDAIQNLGEIDILPASIFGREKVNPLKLKDRIKLLKKKYDIILIDSSPSLNEETLAVMLASDSLLIVTTPDLPTLSTTIKAAKLAKNRGDPIIGLIINKAHNKSFELTPKEIEDTAEIPVMAIIPHDLNILKSLSQFKPSTLYKPRTKASKEYKKLASTIIGEKYHPLRFNKILRWINPSRQDINRTIYYEQMFG
ncbi:MAG: AAA family ATPase [Candidatus Pacearchaeota archaeon]|nr:AAA family ATPase [Candidatus Pacearchaeota archaeon]